MCLYSPVYLGPYKQPRAGEEALREKARYTVRRLKEVKNGRSERKIKRGMRGEKRRFGHDSNVRPGNDES